MIKPYQIPEEFLWMLALGVLSVRQEYCHWYYWVIAICDNRNQLWELFLIINIQVKDKLIYTLVFTGL